MNGSTTNAIYIHITNYEESDPQREHYYNITRNNELIFTQCIPDIPAGNNLTLYACESLVDCTSNPAAVLTGINISVTPVVLSSSASLYSFMTMSIISSDHSSLLLSYSPGAIFLSIATASSTTIVDDNDALESYNRMFVTSGKQNMHNMIIIILLYYSNIVWSIRNISVFIFNNNFCCITCVLLQEKKETQSK